MNYCKEGSGNEFNLFSERLFHIASKPIIIKPNDKNIAPNPIIIKPNDSNSHKNMASNVYVGKANNKLKTNNSDLQNMQSNINKKKEEPVIYVQKSDIKLSATNSEVHNMQPNINKSDVVKKEIKDSEQNTDIKDIIWPVLTIENINTTLKVVGDLKDGAKVKIMDDRYLAEDNSYISSFTRYNSGQSREKIMNFLDHFFEETKRNTLFLLDNIRNSINVDDNISELENIVTNMMVFLHRYDVIREVYKNDTSTYARLGVTRNKFFTFRHSLFRDLVIAKK